MKRICCCLLIICLFLGGCAKGNFADVTPVLDAIESVSFQRTNIDKNNQYTYFEKNLTTSEEIEKFCESLDKVHFVSIDPVKFSSVDYLIVFEGKRQHKLMVSGDEIIYDGLAYKIDKGSLNDAITRLYNNISIQESVATSKLFR